MNGGKYLKGECQQCSGHIEFPAESAGMTTQCPHCGKPTELLLAAPTLESPVPTKASVYTVIAIVILVGGLIGTQIALKRARRLVERKNEAAPSPTAKQAAPASPADPTSKAGFRVSAITLEATPGSSLVYAVGTVRNESARRRFGVKVELDLLDDTRKKVGSAKDYQQALDSKAEWRFRALVVGSKVASARLASITDDQ
jgi:hypothetical protein